MIESEIQNVNNKNYSADEMQAEHCRSLRNPEFLPASLPNDIRVQGDLVRNQ